MTRSDRPNDETASDAATPEPQGDVRSLLADGARLERVRDWTRRVLPRNSVVRQLAKRVDGRLEKNRVRRLIEESGLFDAAWYLSQNPDVVMAGLDPLDHFLRAGAAEGRDPHPLFDLSWYVDRNPDVAGSGQNPLAHYLRKGGIEGRNPHPEFDSAFYLDQYKDVAQAGHNPLVHYIQSGAAEGRRPNRYATELPAVRNGVFVLSAAKARQQRFPNLSPLRLYSVPGLPPRVTIVTDTINRGNLFGGVGTALILGCLLARRRGAGLRIVTTHHKADKANFRRVTEPNGIPWTSEVEFVHADIRDDSAQLDTGDQEIFLTTSWWSTWSVKHAVAEERIIYLLQEDERMFYPLGDDHLRCAETLRSRNLRFVVNTELLYRHFVAEGFDNIRDRGLWFEPAFPAGHYYPTQRAGGGKKNFLFYARPNNVRNLYYRGLEAIEQAVIRGILNPDEWNIHFVGKDLAPVSLGHKCVPTLNENLTWAEYAALLRGMDLGLCLMYTPHPSYPPLDLAACGAVAVTNRFGLKQTLDGYSRNILCVDPDTESLVAGLAAGVRLAADQAAVMNNFREQNIQRNWSHSFDQLLDKLGSG